MLYSPRFFIGTYVGGLRGAGYTRVPMAINFLGLIVMRISLAYALGYTLGLGLFGLWLSIVIETFARAIMMYLAFAAGKWQSVKV